MKNFKLVSGLVFVILFSSVSCTEDQLNEDVMYEFKESRLQEDNSVVPTDTTFNSDVDPGKVKVPD